MEPRKGPGGSHQSTLLFVERFLKVLRKGEEESQAGRGGRSTGVRARSVPGDAQQEIPAFRRGFLGCILQQDADPRLLLHHEPHHQIMP